MKEFNIDDEVDVLIDNEVYKLKCYSINERKSCNITEKNYSFGTDVKNDFRWHLSLTTVKEDKNDI